MHSYRSKIEREREREREREKEWMRERGWRAKENSLRYE